MKSLMFTLLLATSAVATTVYAEENFSKTVAGEDAQIKTLRAQRVAALKAHNQPEAAKLEAELRKLYVARWQDSASANAVNAAPTKGETRQTQLNIIQAKANYEDAVASGNQAEIAKKRAELRVLYDQAWKEEHPRKSAAAH